MRREKDCQRELIFEVYWSIYTGDGQLYTNFASDKQVSNKNSELQSF